MVTRISTRLRVLVILLWLTLSPLAGCQKYAGVSLKTSEYAQALYSAARRQDGAAMQRLSESIESAVTQGELAPHEAGYLEEIIAAANSNNWDQAVSESQRILKENTYTVRR